MIPDWLFQMIALCGGCMSVYGAIKSDLTKAILTAENAAEEASRCRLRIDKHLEVKH